MMKPSSTALLALVCLSAGPAFGSPQLSVSLQIGAPPPVIVRQAPPRRVSEAMVVSPGPGFVWVAGHSSWQGGQWVWIPGMWVNAPRPGAVWVEGRWDERTNVWIEGHWEITQTAQPTTPPPPVVVTRQPSPPVEIIVRDAPPPPRHERRGSRPSREHVWVSGYWIYLHGHYNWVPGHWERPPHGHRGWVEPRWERRGGTHVFIEGHWD